jgi:hypothetical protein
MSGNSRPAREEIPAVAVRAMPRYTVNVNRLTKQEQLVLCVVLGLLLTGWAIKSYRAAHPPAQRIQQARP